MMLVIMNLSGEYFFDDHMKKRSDSINILVSIIKETHGVTVATFGDSLDFPAFFTPNSGFKVKYYFQTHSHTFIHMHISIRLEPIIFRSGSSEQKLVRIPPTAKSVWN